MCVILLHMKRCLGVLSVVCVVSACSSGTADRGGPAAIGGEHNADAGSGELRDAGPDPAADGGEPLARCPTSGRGAIVAPGPCHVFTPTRAGSDRTGDNAMAYHYALEPNGAPRGELVLYLNASLATPAAQIADPTQNFYSALAADGFHVLALAYRSTAVVAVMCKSDAGCYGASRETLIRGTHIDGAASALSDMHEDEGVVFRLDAALRLLARERPQAGWDRFIEGSASSPAERIVWSHISAAGHSQGGGHAAHLGRLFALRRVVQLSSTCDAVDGSPAPWTAASEPWATSPATAFYGLAAPTTFANGKPSGGDTTCAYHAAVWRNMGMDSAHEHDDALICAGQTDHASVIQCAVNAPRWAPLFD